MSDTPEQSDEELAAAWGAETDAEAEPPGEGGEVESVQPTRVSISVE